MLVLVAAAACAAGCHQNPPSVAIDADRVDATVLDAVVTDAAPGDAPSGPPNVTIFTHYTGADPRAGIEVIFSDAAGRFVARATSDVTGAVHGHITAGDQATLVDPDFHNNITVVGLVPGDVLHVGDDHAPPMPMPTTGGIGVTFAPFAGADRYQVSTDCVGPLAAAPGMVVSPRSCRTDGHADALVVALAGPTTPVAYATVADVPFGQTAAFPAWHPGLEHLALTVDHPTPNATDVLIHLARLRAGTAPARDVGGVQVPSATTYPTTTDLAYPAAPGDSWQLHVIQNTSTSGLGLRWVPYLTATLPGRMGAVPPAATLDLTASLPAPMANVAVTEPEPHRPRWTWTGTPTPGSFVYVYLADGARNRWTAYLPPGSTSFQIPEMPADLQSTVVAPVPAQLTFGRVNAVYKSQLSWDRFRGYPTPDEGIGPRLLSADPAATARLSSLILWL